MAFRRPRPPSDRQPGIEQANNRMPPRSSPSLGYRLSSNRQPGIEQANNRMPPRSRPFPRQGLDQMPEYKNPIGIPGMGSYQNMGIGSLTPSNIGVDRHPTTMDPITTMLDNPQVMRDWQDKRKLEEQMDPDNFFGNRLDVSRQFGVGPFDDIFHSEPTGRTLFGDEKAAVDPSDWRVIQQILKGGGNPDDYVQTATTVGPNNLDVGGGPYNPNPNGLDNDTLLQMADMGGTYGDPYEGLDIIDMEILPGAGYGPADEHDFDWKRNRYEDLIDWPSYAARGGLMSLRR